ncbi:hypothetical protein ATE84_3412 [Aquimarina sp. MAR_2010_214]|uniref:hypothetical protein n=1 Tax=Aquimarina sp. MAR_2010_214 TaxID=1250026 RepID=UPI000C70CB05|nr:hypothetical protein [Aquimarina sp. MAR_2010_214]PKV51337.1 hypothetical protein ATE84_3412 [Aquimarina sp. MAR_2010_214]
MINTSYKLDTILINSVIVSGVHKDFYDNWADIEDQNIDSSISGIYFLQRYNNDEIIPISRLIGKDNQGILYIGKSENLTRRLGTLINLINGTSTTGKHSMGLRYQEIEVFQKHLKPENIKLRIIFCDNPRDIESSMLLEYLYKFGELPPLNNSK